MVTFLPQARPEVPRNAFIDQSPIRQGVNAIRQGIEQRRTNQDLAAVNQLARSGGSIEAITNQLMASRNPNIALQGVNQMFRNNQLAQAASEREAAREAADERFKATQEFRDAQLQFQRDRFAQTKRVADAKIEQLDFEARKAENAGGFESEQAKTKFTQNLRKEVATRSGDFIKVRDSFARIQATSDNAAGDLALVFNFMCA